MGPSSGGLLRGIGSSWYRLLRVLALGCGGDSDDVASVLPGIGCCELRGERERMRLIDVASVLPGIGCCELSIPGRENPLRALVASVLPGIGCCEPCRVVHGPIRPGVASVLPGIGCCESSWRSHTPRTSTSGIGSSWYRLLRGPACDRVFSRLWAVCSSRKGTRAPALATPGLACFLDACMTHVWRARAGAR